WPSPTTTRSCRCWPTGLWRSHDPALLCTPIRTTPALLCAHIRTTPAAGMTLVLDPVADVAAPLARRNPVAKLAAALLFALPLIATLDPLTPALGLAV